jgi:putative DNA methylase
MSGTPMPFDYLRREGKSGRMGVRLMAVVAQGQNGRVYLAPTQEVEAVARSAEVAWTPETPLPDNPRNFNTPIYGIDTYGKLFTPRQVVALTTFSDLVKEARERVRSDSVAAGMLGDAKSLRDGGTGALAYAEAVEMYLAMANSRAADYGSSISTWRPKDNAMRSTLAKQAIPMTWDFAEGSPFGESSAGIVECVDVVARVLETSLPSGNGFCWQQDAASAGFEGTPSGAVVSTDPPYYNNVGYAELSDFFYVWLRRTLQQSFPELFATLAVPKIEELVATPYRHGGAEAAEDFFLTGMTKAMRILAQRAHPAYPVTIYYALKQSESDEDGRTVSTGWQTFLDAVIRAGFAISGTWPMRTEGDNRQMTIDANALASSIVLVCRPQAPEAPTTTRREFLTALKVEMPDAIAQLQAGNIAPVDLAQAAIGPGMAVYTRYAKVLDASGKALSVGEALSLINQTLDEVLAQQEGDFDPDTRWALTWFEQSGFDEGEFGVADVLARAKNTSVQGMKDACILDKNSPGGKVRLLKPSELPDNWDPASDTRLTSWEAVHHLIRVLEKNGENAAAELVEQLGTKAEVARELAYRLYSVCERRKRSVEARSYNGLVQSWPEIIRLARDVGKQKLQQAQLFERE